MPSEVGVRQPAGGPPRDATSQKVVVEIGRVGVSFGTDSTRFRGLLEQRYASFVRPSSCPQFHFEVQISFPSAPSPQADLQVSKEAGAWRVERGDFCARWDRETGRGWIRQSANPYSTDTLLRIVHSLALAPEGGFLLHSASAVRRGRAFLFSGVSGAGKTTISRLAPSDARVLTDEISYVCREGTTYRAYGTPFAGELARLGENVSAPISGLFFLAKGKEDRLERMTPSEATRALLRNILFLAHDEELVQKVFHAALAFVSAVPVRRLVFAPTPCVWELIR